MTLTARIVMAMNRLNSTPKPERGPDWRIAKGMLEEAAEYNRLRNTTQAESMLKGARPHLEIAAP